MGPGPGTLPQGPQGGPAQAAAPCTGLGTASGPGGPATGQGNTAQGGGCGGSMLYCWERSWRKDFYPMAEGRGKVYFSSDMSKLGGHLGGDALPKDNFGTAIWWLLRIYFLLMWLLPIHLFHDNQVGKWSQERGLQFPTL